MSTFDERRAEIRKLFNALHAEEQAHHGNAAVAWVRDYADWSVRVVETHEQPNRAVGVTRVTFVSPTAIDPTFDVRMVPWIARAGFSLASRGRVSIFWQAAPDDVKAHLTGAWNRAVIDAEVTLAKVRAELARLGAEERYAVEVIERLRAPCD